MVSNAMKIVKQKSSAYRVCCLGVTFDTRQFLSRFFHKYCIRHAHTNAQIHLVALSAWFLDASEKI